MNLSEIIIQKIQTDGPITFKDFMEMALYYPNLGYYNTDKIIIGTSGDFYTSPSLTPAFGAMIARQIEEMWQILDKQDFTIVEFGAGNGMLCMDILAYLKNNPEMYNGLNYYIIEKSSILKERQRLILTEKVKWIDSIAALTQVCGCILSNEVVDNFAVHQVCMETELMEIYVDYDNGFKEVLRPADKKLKVYFSEADIVLPKGFRTEINIDAIYWMEDISKSLKRGFILTIDYGYPATKLYNEHRQAGTLTCYKNHQANDNPFQNIGDQDITAHVNFSALSHYGSMFGLEFQGMVNQGEFLASLGFRNYLAASLLPGDDLMKYIRQQAFITYQLLVEMGSKFHVLIQSKGMGKQQLLGLTSTNKFENAIQ